MKTAISSYSFQSLIASGQENQLSVIRRAKALGFDAIEFTTLTPHDGSTKADYARKLKEEADANAIAISCYSVGADLLGQAEEVILAQLMEEIDIADALGTHLVRHDIAFAFPPGKREYRGYANCLPEFAEICRKVTQYAAQKGIRTCTENHGYFSQDSLRVEQLVNTVAHPNFGLLVDTGNFLCVDEDPAVAVGRCAPYAFNVHIKDFLFKSGAQSPVPGGFFPTRGGNFLRGTIAGHGVVPLTQCVRALKLAGYDGYLTLEFEGPEEIDFALSHGYETIRQLTRLG